MGQTLACAGILTFYLNMSMIDLKFYDGTQKKERQSVT